VIVVATIAMQALTAVAVAIVAITSETIHGGHRMRTGSCHNVLDPFWALTIIASFDDAKNGKVGSADFSGGSEIR